MLIGPHNYERIFRDIQLSLQSSDEKNVIVFASTSECDSVCGVRILQASLLLDPEGTLLLQSCSLTDAMQISLSC